jgi:hypothetical protein
MLQCKPASVVTQWSKLNEKAPNRRIAGRYQLWCIEKDYPVKHSRYLGKAVQFGPYPLPSQAFA